MTLNESTHNNDFSYETVPPAAEPAESSLLAEVRQAVSLVLVIDEENEIQAGSNPRREHNYGIAFRGLLQLDPDEAYERLTTLLEPLGFTAFIQRDRRGDVVLAVQGLATNLDEETGGGPLRRLVRASGRSPGWLHGVLLLITIASTVYAGSFLLSSGEISSIGAALAAGGPFAITLLLILGIHEMGHYVAARYHKVNVTLPFFIPLPIPGSLGTLGAVIFIRSALKNRKSLFDVGISGPLAGLVVALPLFVIGLLLPPVAFGVPITLSFRGVGVPPLLDFLGSQLVEGSLSRSILLHPVALAAWFGVLLTALNLLPLGQFDGGHVAYALFGRLAWPLAISVFLVLIGMGLFLWPTWLIWAFLAGISGLRHPPPQNDVTPLDRRRQILGILTILIFLLIVVPQPIVPRQFNFIRPQSPGAAPFPTVAAPQIPTTTPFVMDH